VSFADDARKRSSLDIRNASVKEGVLAYVSVPSPALPGSGSKGGGAASAPSQPAAAGPPRNAGSLRRTAAKSKLGLLRG